MGISEHDNNPRFALRGDVISVRSVIALPAHCNADDVTLMPNCS